MEMTHRLLKEFSGDWLNKSYDCLVSQRGDGVCAYFIDLINHAWCEGLLDRLISYTE